MSDTPYSGLMTLYLVTPTQPEAARTRFRNPWRGPPGSCTLLAGVLTSLPSRYSPVPFDGPSTLREPQGPPQEPAAPKAENERGGFFTEFIPKPESQGRARLKSRTG